MSNKSMPNDMQCGACRHWDFSNRSIAPLGECKLIPAESNDFPDSLAKARNGIPVAHVSFQYYDSEVGCLCTSAKFGCVLWEEKEEEQCLPL